LLQTPDPVHWRICSVLESLLTVAEKHGIQMWADYGTLLGLKRERGVILWDYDADLGMFDSDREKLLAAVKLEQQKGTITPLLVMDENYYKDRGCMAAYVAKNKVDYLFLCVFFLYLNVIDVCEI
jgi:lipopolysaccharide cholinephosphotransferase